MRTHKIDILAYKFDTEATDTFNEDIISHSRNSIILNCNYNKILVQYKPENIELNKTSINFFKLRNQPSLIGSIVNFVQVFKILIFICYKFRPKLFIVENFLEGMIAGIIRKFNLVDKTVYLPGDWFAGYKYKRLRSNIANNLLFPYIDYLACRLNDVVADRTGRITESRDKFWGRKIPTTKTKFENLPRIKASNICIRSKKANICFIGEQRQDSGLDIAIRSLHKIRESVNVNLKIIGPKRLYYDNLVKLSQLYKVDNYVKFLGFIERKDFNEVLSDCFCGINILTNMNTYSSQGYPSKTMYYLQYLLPVIVTNGIAPFAAANISDNGLGLIINPVESEFIAAVLKIYSAQERYRENIKKYIDSLPKKGIIDFLKDEKILA